MITFSDAPVRKALRDAIEKVRNRRPFTIDAWGLLPDHLHCLWTLPSGDVDHSVRWKLVKRSVSLVCGSAYHSDEWMTASKTKHRESTIWQRRYCVHCIRDDSEFSRHIDYIYFNPFKHGFVARVCDWPHSTFHRDVAKGIYPRDWGGVADDLAIEVGEPFG